MSLAVCGLGHSHEAGKPCSECSRYYGRDVVQCKACGMYYSLDEDHACRAVATATVYRADGSVDLKNLPAVSLPIAVSSGTGQAIGATEDPSTVRSERNHLRAVNDHLQKLVAATQTSAAEIAALNKDLVAKLETAKNPTAEVVTLRNEVALLQRRLAGLKMRVNSEEGDTNGLVSEARAAATEAQIERDWYRHELERVNPRLVEAHERNGAKPTPAAPRRSTKVPF